MNALYRIAITALLTAGTLACGGPAEEEVAASEDTTSAAFWWRRLPSLPPPSKISAGWRNFSCGDTHGYVPQCWGYGDPRPPRMYSAVTQVTAGGSHACLLTSSGYPYCWGSRTYGATHAPRTRYKHLSAGDSFTCGVTTRDHLRCWGHMGAGSLPSGRGYRQVSAGLWSVCALTNSGYMRCWGDNRHGQATPPRGRYMQVASGAWHGCALTKNRNVRCWGKAADYAPMPPSSMRFKTISSGSGVTCGIRDDDRVLCWGPRAPVTPPGLRLSRVDAGGSGQVCGVLKNPSSSTRDLFCWGNNRRGQASGPSNMSTANPVDVNQACNPGDRALPFSSSEAAFVAWNASSAAPEPARTGHSMPAPYNRCTLPSGGSFAYNPNAYAYIASADAVASSAIGASTLSGSTSGFPHFSDALEGTGVSASRIWLRLSPANLGHDVRGDDWDIGPDGVESRSYSGAQLELALDGDSFVRCSVSSLDLSVDYQLQSGANLCGDDMVSGTATLTNCRALGAAPLARRLSSALLADLDVCGGFELQMSSLQPAGQTEFRGWVGRTGAFFDAPQLSLRGL